MCHCFLSINGSYAVYEEIQKTGLFVAKAIETYQEGLQRLSLTDGPKEKKKSLGSFAMC